MAAGNDTVNIKVKYIPDTSALKNIKEIKMPEIKIGGKDAGKGVFDSYNNAIRDLNRELSKGTDASAITKAFKTVGEETTKVKSQINSMKEAINQSFQSSSNQSLIKDYQNLEKQLKKLDVESQKRRKKSSELSSFKTQNNMSTPQARKEISKADALVAAGEKLSKQDQERLEIAKQIVAQEEELAKLRTQEEIRNAQKEVKTKMASPEFESMMSSGKANQQLNELSGAMSTVTTNANLSTTELKKFKEVESEVVKQTKEAKDQVVKFGDIISGTFLGTSLSNLFQTGLSRGIEFFKDYDEILTRTMMVTGQTREEVNSLTSSYNKLANQLSSTTKDVAAAQLVFYQQGLGTSEALKMTEASIAVSKTGGIDAAEAADRLTAAVRGYQLSAEDAMDIADKMSALDAAAASSVDELTVAMQKSASQARMAGLDLDYYMAYLSTMQEVTREAPENIGTAMKSITSRLQEIKDIGKIEEDGTTFSNVAKALNSVGIAATDSSGQLRTLQDIMNELGPMWATLDKNHKAYLATVLAGNRQQSRFIALMDNYDRAMELVSVSQNASGESAKQLRAYNQGLEASFTRLSNAWQQFATNIADSDTIKGMVDFLSDLIELLNKIPKKITSTLVIFGALNKIITTLSRVNFSDFSTFISGKLGFDNFLEPIDKADNKIAKLGNTVKEFVTNSVKKLDEVTVSFGKNTQGAEDTAEAVNKIEDSAIGASVATVQLNTNKSATAGIIAAESEVTDDYKNVAGEAAENIGKMGTEIANNKNIMDSNDATMEKEIKDTKELANSSINAVPLAQAKKDLAEYNSNINDLQDNKRIAVEYYSEEMERIRSQYATQNSKEYNKYAGAYKRSMIASSKKRAEIAAAGQLSDENFEVPDISEIDYIRKRIPALDASLREVEKSFETYVKGVDSNIAVEEKKRKATKETIKTLENSEKIEKKVQENKLKEAEASETAANADIKEAEASNTASKANSIEVAASNINSNGIDLDFWGNDAKGLGKLGTDYKKGNSLKGLSVNLGEVRKQFSMTSIMSSVMIGSFAKMGASAIGLGDDLSSAAGTFAGFANLLKGFGAKGIIIAAAITGIQYTMDKLIPTSEKVQSKLSELQGEMDELNQKQTDVKGYLDTYNELSGKLVKTEEETSQLNNATKALAETLPDVVTGYDNYGNAIINTTRAMEELQAIQAKQTENAQNQLKTYGELQKSAQNGQKQATIWTSIIGALAIAAGVLLELPSAGISTALVATGSAMLVGDAASVVEMTLDQKNENKKVIEENYNDIYAQILTVEGQFVDKLATEHKSLGDQIMKTLGTSMLEAARTTGAIYIDDLGDELYKTFEQLDGSTLSKIQSTLDSLGVTLDVKDLNYDEARKYVLDRLEDVLEQAGFKGEQIESIVNVVLNVKFDAAIDVAEARKAIKKAIEESKIGDNDYRIDLDRFDQALGQLDSETLKAMNDLGLLDVKFAEVYTNIEDKGFAGNKEIGITEMFRDANGQINETIGALRTYETALSQVEKYQNMQQYETGYGYASTQANIWEGQIKSINDSMGTNYKWEDIFGEDKLTTMGKWASEWERSGEALKYWNNIANTAYATMDSKLLPTFAEVSNILKETKESFEALNSVAEHLDDTKGILDVDGLTGLFDVFASFEDSATSSVDSWNAWVTALTAVNNGISYENGLLHLNAEAMSGVNAMVQEATKAKYQQMVADIDEAQNSLKMQKTVLQAELSAVKTQINALETLGKSKYDEAEFEKETKNTLTDNLDTINIGQIQSEEEKVQKILEINQAGFNQLLAMQQQYANGEATSFTLKDYSGEYKKAVDKFKKDRTENLLSLITDDYDTTLSSLKAYEAALEEQIAVLDGKILQGDVEKKFFQDIIDGKVDLSKSMNFGNADDSVSDYNEQLERTLTLLEKIEGLQHKIEENNTFKDLYDGYSGEDYGRLLMSNLDLAQQQYDVYKDLFDMQQEMTNQAAGDLLDSPYGQMFKIQENGDIGWADLTMYDKYKNLPNDMKEDIDNLVEAYQNQRDALRDTENDLAKYAQEVKKVREELVQMQIEIENELVDAIKNREKILHDARVKALDDEIDMIEKAVEARKKAQEDDNSNKELYKAQEALRRATLDSSGKNNAQLLQLQQDLEDKQLEIAEKRFEDDMDDRKQWLQDTKDAESETYDYRLEKMTWYWEQVQAIQEEGTEAMMETLIHWNEEYRQQSALQQSEMEREWKETMDAMKAATDMGAELDKLTSDIVSVTQTIEAMDIKIQALPGSWQKATDAANAYVNAANRASSVKNYVSGGSGGGNTTTTQGSENPNTEINKYIGWVGKTVEFDADNKTIDTYNTDGSKNGKAKDKLGFNKNVKVLASANIPGQGWSLLTDGFTGYIPVKYFTSGGWGPFGAKRIGPSYLSGGMVDYTGPAWVDGNKTHPEAFLSAYQTEQIGALAKSLDPSTVNNATTNSNITFGSINFNVASMSSAADGKKALDVFVQGANDMMAKKGIGTKLNINMK